MTLVYSNANTGTNTPQTHVLAIGVGRYAHLENGSGPPAQDVPPLGQLTSPPVSARRFAKWFTDGSMQNAQAPLGSVELLLSDAKDQWFVAKTGDAPQDVEAATVANIASAFKRWSDRCDLDPGNVAIFFFCGHGLQKVNMLLLPEDFGKTQVNPWADAIDFDQTYKGMSHCPAKTQLYVIDACRQVSSTMITEGTVSGTTLRRLFADREKTLRTAPKLYATAEGLPAFGDSGKVSRFTSAVLAALGGGAAQKKNGTWQVSTTTLRDAVRRMIEVENQSLTTDKQQFVATDGEEVGSTVLHTLPDNETPDVLVKLSCVPGEATRLGRLVLEGKKTYKRVAKSDQLSARVPAGVYKLYAEFTSQYSTTEPIAEEWIQPPVFEFEIRVEAT